MGLREGQKHSVVRVSDRGGEDRARSHRTRGGPHLGDHAVDILRTQPRVTASLRHSSRIRSISPTASVFRTARPIPGSSACAGSGADGPPPRRLCVAQAGRNRDGTSFARLICFRYGTRKRKVAFAQSEEASSERHRGRSPRRYRRFTPLRSRGDRGSTGIGPLHTRMVGLADGPSKEVPCEGPVIVSVLGRECFTGAIVMGDEVLLGAVPMEDLDLWISPALNRLVPIQPARYPMSVARVPARIDNRSVARLLGT